ncbi:hypothetical protein, variant [Exophiala mesophila]|uniref:Putative zinc-finger domain-containing protein n=1 Tax=Exophiala mesophila TaxID=212818 RepID=A0A0D1ZWI9_EXOME|nr:hypothetical protein, variant [Exophiala mesophila]KIV91173.1 hypothetical protein, variant [Exophiala mesophila]
MAGAQPYPSTPLYTTTPSYPSQPSFYSSAQSNVFHQPVHTPPAPPPQHPQHHHQQLPPNTVYQPSPQNASRFDTNSQHRPPAAPFPFGAASFTPEMLKQLASAGLPPPPPPAFAPASLPTSAYPQYSTPNSVSVSSPYPQHELSAPHQFGSGFFLNTQNQPTQPAPYTAPGSSGFRPIPDYHSSNDQGFSPYSATRPASKSYHPPAPANAKHADRGHDDVLPSFGSRSDLDMLFANAQQQSQEAYQDDSTASYNKISETHETGRRPPTDGSASPYDPTRPATIIHRTLSRIELPKNAAPQLDGSSGPQSISDLREAAKEAVLSLFTNDIRYRELITEGIDPAVLSGLYKELNIEAEPSPANSSYHQASAVQSATAETLESNAHGPPDAPAFVARGVVERVSSPSTDVVQPEAASKSSLASNQTPQMEVSPALSHSEKPQTTPNANLERKDRIAQLLAARTGRTTMPSPVPASSLSTVPGHSSGTVVANLDGVGLSKEQQLAPPLRTDSLRQSIETSSQDETTRSQHGNLDPLLASHQSEPSSQKKPPLPSAEKAAPSYGASIFAIPGLFMGAAEMTSEDNDSADMPRDQEDILTPPQYDPYTPQPILKRPRPEELSTSEPLPQSKRLNSQQFTEQATPLTEVPMDDDASEGEIVEETEGSRGSRAHANIERLESYDRQANSQLQSAFGNRPAVDPKSSTSQSYSTTDTSTLLVPGVNDATSSKPPLLAQSTTPESLNRQSLTSKPISKLTPAELAEKAAALKAEFLKQRARRQQVLQEELPDLNAEVKQTEVRLEKAKSALLNLRSEIAKLKNDLDRAEKSETDLTQEVAHLEKQLQQGRSGQKQYSDELQKLKLDKKENMSDSIGAEVASRPPEQQGLPLSSQDLAPQGSSKVVSDIERVPVIDATHDYANNDRWHPTASSAQVIAPSLPQLAPEGPAHDETADEVQQTDEMEISPEPEPLTAEGLTTGPTTSRSISPDSPIEDDVESDGSASMSNSGSDDDDEEDYEPADGDAPQPMDLSDDDSDSDEYDPENATTTAPPIPDVVDVSNQSHESTSMAELVPSQSHIVQQAIIHDLPNKPVPSEPSLAEVALVRREEPQTTSTVLPNGGQGEIQKATGSIDANAVTKHQNNKTLESEKAVLLDGSSPPNPHYVPYKTPLSSFKTYRFHQDFHDTVKSGYRSLTYSNSIDPSRPLCPTELSGEVCEDPTCEEQHFRQLGLSDDKILVQMSSASDIKDKGIRDEFLVGLKQVIADLRQKEVKEFENVANALSAYRREFFSKREEA